MDKKDLMLVSANFVIESKLTKQAKLQMLNFIQKEADEFQLMNLLMTGQISQIKEDEQEQLKEDFDKKFKEVKTESIDKLLQSKKVDVKKPLNENQELKIQAGKIVIESDITKEEKQKYLDFLKGANKEQVMSYILDGVMLENIDDISKDIINDRFKTMKVA